MTRTGLQLDRDTILAAYRFAEATNVGDIVMRSVLIFLSGIGLFAISGEVGMIFWGTAFVAGHALFVRLIETAPTPASRLRLTLISLLNVTLVLWVVGMIVRVATWAEPVAVLLACSGTAGLALHTLVNHRVWSVPALIDTSGVLAAKLGVTIALSYHADGWDEVLAVLLVASGLLVYFVQGLRDIIGTRTRLDARRAAEVQAEKLEAIGQLSAGVAHDFNNILTVIRGNLDLISEVETPATQHEFLSESRHAADRAAHLVRQLLAFSRKSHIHPEVVALPDVVGGAAELLARALPATVTLTVRPGLPDVRLFVDAKLLQTALLNAVFNARDAVLETGGGTIEIGASVTGGEVALLIEDTGPGLPADLLGRVSQPFFTTKPVGAGSGLGLSMIEGFAEQSGGRLELGNRKSGGLRVAIVLPVHDADRDPAGPAAPVAPGDKEQESDPPQVAPRRRSSAT